MFTIPPDADKKAAVLFALLCILWIGLLFLSDSVFAWAFARHRNPLSWYIRPLLLVPFCTAAYRRSCSGIWASLFLILTSMVWFPEPESPHADIQTFLQMEQDFLRSGWTVDKGLAALAVLGSLALTAAAFWRRSFTLGAYYLMAMAGGKILWSVTQGGTAGKQVILPAIFGLTASLVLLRILLRRKK